jgi:hypothetical protein
MPVLEMQQRAHQLAVLIAFPYAFVPPSTVRLAPVM